MYNNVNKKMFQMALKVKYILLILSGKGGVGKTVFSSNLALQAFKKGYKVGLLDIDIHGANTQKMFNINGILEKTDNNDIKPISIKENFLIAGLGLAGYNNEDAIIWRSPIKTNIIRQFLSEVNWGELDYLIIDTPAGTGDEVLTIIQNIPVSGSIVISAPQQVSIIDSAKSINFSLSSKTPVLGIVENMSHYIMPDGMIHRPYLESSVLKLAKKYDVKYLGELPFDFEFLNYIDQGKIFDVPHDNAFYLAFKKIFAKIEIDLKNKEEAGIFDILRDELRQRIKEIDDNEGKNNNSDFKPVK